jgi:hypothetical protein
MQAGIILKCSDNQFIQWYTGLKATVINCFTKVKPITDEHVFYDNFSYEKFYLFVCKGKFAKFLLYQVYFVQNLLC